MTEQVLSWLACKDKKKEQENNGKEAEEKKRKGNNSFLERYLTLWIMPSCAKIWKCPISIKLHSYQTERYICRHPPFHINVRHLFSSEECIIFQHHLICVPYNYAQFICLWFPRRDVQSWSRKRHVHREHIHPHF
jgi:hypothetical protein